MIESPEMERRFSDRDMAVKMFEMLLVPEGSWVNNFRLKGQTHSEQGRIVALIGYFPREAAHELIIFDKRDNREEDLLAKALKFQVPADMKNLVPDNEELHKQIIDKAQSLHIPTIVLVFAINYSSNEEYIGLYAAVGQSPDTALSTIQSCIKKEKIRQN